MWTPGRAAGGALSAILLSAAGAQAQDFDPTARYDVDEALHRHAHDISRLPTKEAAEGRPITFDLSVAGAYSTNAGLSRHDEVGAGYVTPGLGFGATPVTVSGWDVGGGAKIDADYYSGGRDRRFGEGRVEGFAFAEHALGPGRLTAEAVLFGAFDNRFANQQFRLLISNLTYSVSRGGLSADFAAEYEDSDVPALRRTRLITTVAYTLPKPRLGYELTVEGDVAFADFNGGANRDRNDTTAALVLTAAKQLSRGWSLEWEAGLINRFSNRDSSRFTVFDLGVELAKRF